MEQDNQPELIPSTAEASHYPSLLKRVQSIFIDALLLLTLMFVIYAAIGDNEHVSGLVRGLLLYGCCILYEPLCVAYGCTVGHYLMKIRVRKASDESQRISLGHSFLRVIVKSLLGWLSFVVIHFNEHKRAVHDMASGSVMIEVE